MRLRAGRSIRVLTAVLAAAASSQAAYHYVHYPSRNNFTPIYEKFNLAALPNNTVTFFVNDQGPAGFAPNDSFGSVLAQVKAALAAWNSVSASDLRVKFGGLESYTANPTASNPGGPVPTPNTPGADVIFVDTPGLLGMGAPTTSTVQAQGPNGPFYPIQRGVVMLARDTSDPNSGAGPSYTEEFFTTAVHEIGHALGLQHTWTASAMSQDVIRTTSRARPLDADDIASLAELYGKPNWQANYGSISGRVRLLTSGQGVALASVVAISPTGPAVSTLTNPDGTYRIDGLPANYPYLVYAHPLPPDAVPADSSGLRLPVDQNGQPFQPGPPFVTSFNAGGGVTMDPQQAAVYNITPGAVVSDVNFQVQARSGVPTYDVLTYSRINTATRVYTWPGDFTVQGYPAFVDSTRSAGLVVAQAASPAVLPAPQSVTMLGGFPTAILNNPTGNVPTVIPYPDQPAMAIYFSLPAGSGTGPRHLVFNFGSDIYVMPYAVDLVQKGPPVVSAATPNGDGTVTITGAGIGPDSRVFFDGTAAAQGPFSGTDAQGSITVTPPPAAPGQVSTIIVYGSDGQNSMILQSSNPPTYTYPAPAAPQLTAISPQSLPAGSSAMLDITAANSNFVDGQVSVGFGSNDVTVRRVWVLSPTHLVANVVVAPNAALGMSEVSVISGMQSMSQANAFQVQAAAPGTPLIALPIANADPTQPGLYPGSFASIYGLNLATGLAGSTQVMLNGQSVAVVFASAGQVNFQIPANFPVGPATVQLTSGGVPAFPVEIQIDRPAPVIAAVNTATGAPLNSTTPAAAGDTLTILANGLDPALAGAFQGRLRVTVAGLDMAVTQVSAQPGNTLQIQAILTQAFGSSQVPLTVVADGSASAPVNIVVK